MYLAFELQLFRILIFLKENLLLLANIGVVLRYIHYIVRLEKKGQVYSVQPIDKINQKKERENLH